jgi:hypothetical protein
MNAPSGNGNVHEALWRSPDGARFEHVRLRESGQGFEADGLVIRSGADEDVRVRYRITGDASWRTRTVRVESLDGRREPLLLTSDGEGHWHAANGAPVPALAGCSDVDVFASPFTNTIPIRRLALEPGASAEIKAAFVRIPELDVEPHRQRYTRLHQQEGNDVYRYESVDTGFSAHLPVDAEGLLLEYPGYFVREWR